MNYITSAGVYDTGSLAAEVVENLKDSAAYVETVLREATDVSKKHLAIGERTDGIVYAAENYQFDGENLDFGEDDEVVLTVDGTGQELRLGAAELGESTATHLKFLYTRKDFEPL